MPIIHCKKCILSIFLAFKFHKAVRISGGILKGENESWLNVHRWSSVEFNIPKMIWCYWCYWCYFVYYSCHNIYTFYINSTSVHSYFNGSILELDKITHANHHTKQQRSFCSIYRGKIHATINIDRENRDSKQNTCSAKENFFSNNSGFSLIPSLCCYVITKLVR